jgi:hypothetical protein
MELRDRAFVWNLVSGLEQGCFQNECRRGYLRNTRQVNEKIYLVSVRHS